MISKRTDQRADGTRGPNLPKGKRRNVMDRRAFLRLSGFSVGSAFAVTNQALRLVKPAAAAAEGSRSADTSVLTVCTRCSMGCSVRADLLNGVWISQQPVAESPISACGWYWYSLKNGLKPGQ